MRPVLGAFVALLLLTNVSTSLAQQYPTRAVRFVVAYPAGGGTDVVARVLASHLDKRLGQPVIVENRTGAGGLIGGQSVVRAEPDGYTFSYGPTAVLSSVFAKNNPIDASKDFAPVSTTHVNGLFFVVRPTLPVKTVNDLITYSKNNPGKLNFGAIASLDLLMGLVKERTGITAADIPFAGDAPAINAVLGEQVDMTMTNIIAALPHIQSGKVHPLFTSRKVRSSALPSLPTAQEAGVSNFSYEANIGLWAPAATPKDLTQRVSREAIGVAKQKDFADQVAKFGAQAVGSTPEEQLRGYQEEMAIMREAARITKYEPK